jgi:hypothetical protein
MFITHDGFKDIFNHYFPHKEYEVTSNAFCFISNLLDRIASKDFSLGKAAQIIGILFNGETTSPFKSMSMCIL